MKRSEWILRQQDVLAAIHEERQLALDKLSQSGHDIRDRVHAVLDPSTAAIEETPSERISSFISRGMTIYEGVRIGLTAIRAVSTLFGGRKKKRRR